MKKSRRRQRGTPTGWGSRVHNPRNDPALIARRIAPLFDVDASRAAGAVLILDDMSPQKIAEIEAWCQCRVRRPRRSA